LGVLVVLAGAVVVVVFFSRGALAGVKRPSEDADETFVALWAR
jgi:hypothetical protein